MPVVRSGKEREKVRTKAAPEHVGGKPYKNLTSKQKAAVIELAVTEDETYWMNASSYPISFIALT